MPKRPNSEGERRGWLPVRRIKMNAGEITDAYQLEKPDDKSLWIAFNSDEHNAFMEDIRARLDKMEGLVSKRPGLVSSATVSPSKPVDEKIFCTQCGSHQSSQNNYCRHCGTRL